MRAMTKKVVNFFGEEKCTPDKILARPMVPGVNLLESHCVGTFKNLQAKWPFKTYPPEIRPTPRSALHR